MIPPWLDEILRLLHLPLIGGVAYLVYRELIKDYQHKMIWADYKKRHDIPNGEK